LIINKEEFQKYIIDITGSQEYQRSNGDTLEDLIKNFLIHKKVNIVLPKTNRTIEDFSFNDIFYDVKTRNLDKPFNMPNLISYSRLDKNIIKANKELVYIFIEYKIVNGLFIIENLHNNYYYEINPDVLRWGNLGTAQLQISPKKEQPLIKPAGKEIFIKKIYESYTLFCYDLIKKVINRIPTLTNIEKKEMAERING